MKFPDHIYNKSGVVVPQRLYREFNKLYFADLLPDIQVRWSRKKTKPHGYSGVCHFTPLSIFLNPSLKGWDRIWSIVLLHEMVHVEQRHDIRKKYHGRKFQNRMKQLAALGAFEDLW